MLSERLLAMVALVLGGLLVEQAGLGPRVRAGAWTALCVAGVAYAAFRVLPAIR